MKKLNYSWKFTTTIIPNDAEVVCENAVSADDTGIGGALVKFKSTGIYAIINAGVIKTCDQRAAQKFDELTKRGGA